MSPVTFGLCGAATMTARFERGLGRLLAQSRFDYELAARSRACPSLTEVEQGLFIGPGRSVRWFLLFGLLHMTCRCLAASHALALAAPDGCSRISRSIV